MRRVRALPGSGSDRGTTLVELLVSMSIFSLCMTVVFGAVILVVRKSDEVQKSAGAVSELRIALARIDLEARSGNLLFSPASEAAPGTTCTANAADSGTCMRMLTQLNGIEKCVQWQVTADDPAHPGSSVLRTRTWAINWKSTDDVPEWETVARGLTMTAGEDPFRLQGAETVYQERLLDVRLEAYDTRAAAGVVVESSVSGRNTTYGYAADQCAPVPPA